MFFISIIAEIIVIIAPLTKLINVDLHISQAMINETILSISAVDIIEKTGAFIDAWNSISFMPRLSGYLEQLSALSYLIIASSVVCTLNLLINIVRYSYNGQNKNASRFGVHFERFSSIPSIIMSVLVLIFIRAFFDANIEYISVKPTMGAIIIIICAIVHIVINCITDDCRKENKAKRVASETHSENGSADTSANTANENAEPVMGGALAKLSDISKDKSDKGTWNCYHCGTLNNAGNEKCIFCGKNR